MSSPHHSSPVQPDDLLRQWAQQVVMQAPAVTVPDLPVAAARNNPRRQMLTVAAAMLLIITVAGATQIWRASRSGHETVAPALVSSGNIHNYVLHDGQTVQASGRIVAPSGHPVQFCPELVSFANNPPCGPHLIATNINLGQIANRHEIDDVVYGDATLTGIYRGRTIEVTSQGPPTDSTTPPTDEVPCPEPTSGWHGPHPGIGDAETYGYFHGGSVVMVAVLHPRHNPSVVYVLTTADPAIVQRALRPSYGDDVCVVRSRYTKSELAAARQLLGQIATDQNRHEAALTTLYESGAMTLAPDEQPAISAGVPIVSANLAHTLDAQPAGIVQLEVWLRPVH